MTVHVIQKWLPNPYDCPEVNTVSASGDSIRELSPFILGPIIEGGLWSGNFENFWQFSKVYKEHTTPDGKPSAVWYGWRGKGFSDKYARRYPMGKGRKPEYSYWFGEHLGYIEARKKIYAPIYAKYVVRTVAYELLEEVYKVHGEVTLKDYDAYDHIKMGISLIEVINDPNRIMGHSFVLAMLLEGKLEECLA